MLDIQLLRTDLTAVAARLATRGGQLLDTARFTALEGERQQLQTRTEELQAKRNALSKQIGQMKGKGEDTSAVMAEVARMKQELEDCEARLAALRPEMDDFLARVPNLPHDSVPIGSDEHGFVAGNVGL